MREQAQDLYTEEGQDPDEYGFCARIVPVSDTAHLWSVENNLNLGNMDWRDFANATDGNGIFRGFT